MAIRIEVASCGRSRPAGRARARPSSRGFSSATVLLRGISAAPRTRGPDHGASRLAIGVTLPSRRAARPGPGGAGGTAVDALAVLSGPSSARITPRCPCKIAPSELGQHPPTRQAVRDRDLVDVVSRRQDTGPPSGRLSGRAHRVRGRGQCRDHRSCSVAKPSPFACLPTAACTRDRREDCMDGHDRVHVRRRRPSSMFGDRPRRCRQRRSMMAVGRRRSRRGTCCRGCHDPIRSRRWPRSCRVERLHIGLLPAMRRAAA